MVELWDEQLMLAKYHLSIAKRLFENFGDYETKKFLSSCVSEMARCCTKLVNAYLIYFYVRDGIRIPGDSKRRMKIFRKRGGEDVVENVLKIFEIRRAQKNSPIELLRGDKILLLDNGEYRALTKERLSELLAGLDEGIKGFGRDFAKD